jgi:hypothetical protein
MLKQKVVRRTLKVRHSALPRRKRRRIAAGSHSFLGMLAMLGGASQRLQRARARI